MLISNQYNQIQTNEISKTSIKATKYQTEQIDRNKHADTLTFSCEYEKMRKIEQNIANRYDVTNMSELG